MRGDEVNTFAQVFDRYQGVLLEYCFLAALPTLSEEQADYLDLILAQAETDEILNFLLIEFDRISLEKLNLFDEHHISKYDDQQAYLREHLVQATRRWGLLP